MWSKVAIWASSFRFRFMLKNIARGTGTKGEGAMCIVPFSFVPVFLALFFIMNLNYVRLLFSAARSLSVQTLLISL